MAYGAGGGSHPENGEIVNLSLRFKNSLKLPCSFDALAKRLVKNNSPRNLIGFIMDVKNRKYGKV